MSAINTSAANTIMLDMTGLAVAKAVANEPDLRKVRNPFCDPLSSAERAAAEYAARSQSEVERLRRQVELLQDLLRRKMQKRCIGPGCGCRLCREVWQALG